MFLVCSVSGLASLNLLRNLFLERLTSISSFVVFRRNFMLLTSDGRQMVLYTNSVRVFLGMPQIGVAGIFLCDPAIVDCYSLSGQACTR